jgi:hypothetical protein
MDYLRLMAEAIETAKIEDPSWRWPEVLYLQLDNASGPNKNDTLISFLSMLVHRGIFRKVKINFMLTGHTHGIVDQMFSHYSTTIHTRGCRTIKKVSDVFHSAYRAVVQCLENTTMESSFIDQYGKRVPNEIFRTNGIKSHSVNIEESDTLSQSAEPQNTDSKPTNNNNDKIKKHIKNKRKDEAVDDKPCTAGKTITDKPITVMLTQVVNWEQYASAYVSPNAEHQLTGKSSCHQFTIKQDHLHNTCCGMKEYSNSGNPRLPANQRQHKHWYEKTVLIIPYSVSVDNLPHDPLILPPKYVPEYDLLESSLEEYIRNRGLTEEEKQEYILFFNGARERRGQVECDVCQSWGVETQHAPAPPAPPSSPAPDPGPTSSSSVNDFISSISKLSLNDLKKHFIQPNPQHVSMKGIWTDSVPIFIKRSTLLNTNSDGKAPAPIENREAANTTAILSSRFGKKSGNKYSWVRNELKAGDIVALQAGDIDYHWDEDKVLYSWYPYCLGRLREGGIDEKNCQVSVDFLSPNLDPSSWQAFVDENLTKMNTHRKQIITQLRKELKEAIEDDAPLTHKAITDDHPYNTSIQNKKNEIEKYIHTDNNTLASTTSSYCTSDHHEPQPHSLTEQSSSDNDSEYDSTSGARGKRKKTEKKRKVKKPKEDNSANSTSIYGGLYIISLSNMVIVSLCCTCI